MSVNKSLIWDLLAGQVSGTVRQALGEDPLAAVYRYEPAPLQVTETELADDLHHRRRLVFTKRGGHQVAGIFIRPRAEGVYPCVLLLHALNRSKEEMVRHFGPALAERGVAALALDAHLHGERQSHRSEQLSPLEWVELARETIIEYRQALDYLETRPDLQPGAFGLLGYSLGAMMGCILAGVDQRVQASVLMVGGDLAQAHRERLPLPLRGMLDTISPSRYAPRISPRPVFFLNGRHDQTVSEAAARLMHEAAREPKRVLWADAGHHLPPEVAVQGVDWIAEQLRERQISAGVKPAAVPGA